jgi:hypothetical protein
MARNVFEGCCAVRSRDHGACWPDQSHTYQSIMKLLSIKRLSNNSQLQGGNVSKLAMSFTTFGICCWRRCHRKVSCDCTELSHCTENYKCKKHRDPLTGWPQATSAEPVGKANSLTKSCFTKRTRDNGMVVKGLVACKLHGRNTETITVNHSHQLAGCIHNMEVVHWALRRCLLSPLPPRGFLKRGRVSNPALARC